MSSSCSRAINPLIDHLARLGRLQADAALSSLGVRLRHVVVLTVLRDHGAATQRGLSSALGLDPSNVVGVLNELEPDGLVVRLRDRADRRRHVVEITERGAQRLELAERELAQVEDAVLGALEPGERAELYALLAKAAGGRVAVCTGALTEADHAAAEVAEAG